MKSYGRFCQLVSWGHLSFSQTQGDAIRKHHLEDFSRQWGPQCVDSMKTHWELDTTVEVEPCSFLLKLLCGAWSQKEVRITQIFYWSALPAKFRFSRQLNWSRNNIIRSCSSSRFFQMLFDQKQDTLRVVPLKPQNKEKGLGGKLQVSALNLQCGTSVAPLRPWVKLH